MYRFSALAILVAASFLTLSCGTGRQLQSISISQTTSGQQIQFVATGNFSSAPMTVTPLPVQWTNGLMAPPPPTYTYTLTTQPYVFNCVADTGVELQVGAYAPTNPNPPTNGSTKHPVIAYATVQCP